MQRRHAPACPLPVHQGNGEHRQRRHHRHQLADQGHDGQGGPVQGARHQSPLPHHRQHDAAERRALHEAGHRRQAAVRGERRPRLLAAPHEAGARRRQALGQRGHGHRQLGQCHGAVPRSRTALPDQEERQVGHYQARRQVFQVRDG